MDELTMQKTLDNMNRLFIGEIYSNFAEYYTKLRRLDVPEKEATEQAYAMCEVEAGMPK